MKKFLFLAVVAICIVSCLNSGSFYHSYRADITFEFSESVYQESCFKDSVYVMDGEVVGDAFSDTRYPIFFGQNHTSGIFNGGFLMSILKGEADGALTREAKLDDKYRVHAATGASGSKTYAVFYGNPSASMMPKYDIDFFYKSYGTCSPYSCYVNNTTYVARMIQEHFADGDKLVLTASGWREGGEKTTASIVLAEYSEQKDTIMYNWTKFDLSKLGFVDYIDIEVVSTNPNVPAYCCIDNFSAGVNIEY
jgi:hypothetical protein